MTDLLLGLLKDWLFAELLCFIDCLQRFKGGFFTVPEFSHKLLLDQWVFTYNIDLYICNLKCPDIFY